MRADRQTHTPTDTHTHTLIAILRTPVGDQVTTIFFFCCALFHSCKKKLCPFQFHLLLCAEPRYSMVVSKMYSQKSMRRSFIARPLTMCSTVFRIAITFVVRVTDNRDCLQKQSNLQRNFASSLVNLLRISSFAIAITASHYTDYRPPVASCNERPRWHRSWINNRQFKLSLPNAFVLRQMIDVRWQRPAGQPASRSCTCKCINVVLRPLLSVFFLPVSSAFSRDFTFSYHWLYVRMQFRSLRSQSLRPFTQ